jgi:hypothetical protein
MGMTRRGAGVTAANAAKGESLLAKKGRDYMAVCGDCMQLIDLNKILPLIRRNLRVTHSCGKVLHRGRDAPSAKS